MARKKTEDSFEKMIQDLTKELNRAPLSIKPLPTLSVTVWPVDFFKEWKKGFNRASYVDVIQRFIDYNQRYFDYLGISATICPGGDGLQLTTSSYIGATPLRAPDSGKIVSVLTVVGRYGEKPQELLSVLESSIRPEYNPEWSLTVDCPVTPPVFMECCSFIDLYLEAERTQWRKFGSKVEDSRKPSGATIWTDYALRSASNPQMRTVFRNRVNYLSAEHTEQWMLNYVCKLAIDKLSSSAAPPSTRMLYGERCGRARRLLANRGIQETDAIPVHGSDPAIVRKLKELAVAILSDRSSARYAWRMDYADFFERYVQYLFLQATKKIGGSVECNPHFSIHAYAGQRPGWGLAYLEPDLIVRTPNDDVIVVDAKYKSHIYNYFDSSEQLRDTFRSDLHQIVAYSSLAIPGERKRVVLAYPAADFRYRLLEIEGIGQLRTEVFLLGIPIDAQKLPSVIESLQSTLRP